MGWETRWRLFCVHTGTSAPKGSAKDSWDGDSLACCEQEPAAGFGAVWPQRETKPSP